MIVAYQNYSKLLWLPVYSLNDKHHNSIGFQITAISQFLIYCISAYVIIRTCQISVRIKIFHENMVILLCWFLLQWFEAIIAKAWIMLYQTGTIGIGKYPDRAYFAWWTEDREKMVLVDDLKDIMDLYVASCFMWHYIYSVIFAPVVVIVERGIATWYIQDYENVRRRHIPILLIIVTNLITIPYAHFIINNRIPFLIAYAQCVLNAGFVFFGYSISWKVHARWRKQMDEPQTDGEQYSLAKKFQIEENIRFIVLIRKMVLVIVIYLSLSLTMLICLVFELIQGYDWIFVHLLDNVILSAALVISIALLFCSPSWRDAFIGGIPIIRRFRKPPVSLRKFSQKVSQVPETELYFIQLKNAWV